MARNHRSAKKAGANFERDVADYLAKHVDERVDRRVKTGSKDRGDIAGLRHMCQRIVIECKNYGGQIKAKEWTDEADIARGNDDALAGVVAAKRKNTTNPADQWVVMTLEEFVAILNGSRDHTDEHRTPKEAA